MYHLVKLEHLLTSYVRVCAARKPAETILPHISVTIIGKRRKEDTLKVLKKKKKEEKENHFGCCFFTWILGYMANVWTEGALKVH